MIYFYGVILHLDSGTLYLTDNSSNYTDPSTGDNYVTGSLKIDQSVKQKSTPSSNDFSIELSAITTTFISAFTADPYKGRKCEVIRFEIDNNGNQTLREVWLEGELNKYTFTNTDKTSTMKITVGSVFSSFEAVKMINLNLKFSEYINDDQTLYWGKEGV